MRNSCSEYATVYCPHCRSSHGVIRKGSRKNKPGPKQIYLCKIFGKRFSEHKTIPTLSEGQAAKYLTKATSLESVADDTGLSKTTFYRRLREEARRCPDWDELLKMEKRSEKWGLALGVDTTGLNIRRVPYIYLHVADVTLGHPIAYKICAKKDVGSIEPVLRHLRDSGYNPQIVVTDLAPELLASIKNIWPSTIIQGCIFHVRRRLNKLLPTKNIVRGVGRELVMLWRKLKNIINCICVSKDEQTRQKYLEQLDNLNLDEKSKCFVDNFLKDLKYYHLLDELKGFGTNVLYNNLCECNIGMIRRLERKMLCFKSIEAAQDFIKLYWDVKRRIRASKEEIGEIANEKQYKVLSDDSRLPLFCECSNLAELSSASGVSKEDLAKKALKTGRIVIGDYAFSKDRLIEMKKAILELGETSVGAVMRETGYDESTTMDLLKTCGFKVLFRSFDPWGNKVCASGLG